MYKIVLNSLVTLSILLIIPKTINLLGENSSQTANPVSFAIIDNDLHLFASHNNAIHVLIGLLSAYQGGEGLYLRIP